MDFFFYFYSANYAMYILRKTKRRLIVREIILTFKEKKIFGRGEIQDIVVKIGYDSTYFIDLDNRFVSVSNITAEGVLYVENCNFLIGDLICIREREA